MKIASGTDLERLRQLAFRLADERREVVYIIKNPYENPNLGITSGACCLPYVIPAVDADAWEKENGELIPPRRD